MRFRHARLLRKHMTWMCCVVAFHGGYLRAQTPKDRAWNLLRSGVSDKNAETRMIAVRVLGLLPNSQDAATLAEGALTDEKPGVRAAASLALGEMDSRSSIPKLREALKDKETEVVMSSAVSLRRFGDSAGYEVYYAVLTGSRKNGGGLLDEQKKMLKDPKKMAQFGFDQGIGFIPFAGLGLTAVKMLTKDDVSPVRAAAAKNLATDPDPGSGEALVQATSDKSWLVRAAALDAIAQRGDPALADKIWMALDDQQDVVRYTAAAAIARLTGTSSAKPKKK